ncbi:MAG: S41 family peptidase [Ignavibacteriales bacterium]
MKEEKTHTKKTITKKEVINPQFKTTEVVFLLVITFAITFGMSFLIFYNPNSKKYDIEEADKDIQNFIKEYNYIIDNYYGDVNKEELLDKALAAMVASLDDPYSTFMDDTSNSALISLEGSFQGIGVEIVNDAKNNIVVVRAIEDSPASKAGVQPLDVIKKINDVSLEGTTTTDFVKMVSEQKDASFDLTLLRNGTEQVVTVTRELVTLKSVKSEIFEQNNKKIGYINVSIFAANTYTQFKDELVKLEKGKIDSLIIDLRSNGGGHLSSVTNMISLFLDSSHVVYQTQTKKETEKIYSTGKVTKKYPIVLLSDNQSASASEVMMGALKDEYNATIIGTTTFGKGTVQELLTLPSDAQYKLTTKKWLTPNGTWVNGIGIKPDVEVKLSDEYLKNPSNETDNQLQEAIKYLSK